MKRVKDIFIGILIGCMLITTPVLADTIVQKIDVVLNGVKVQVNGADLNAGSILYNGTTYLPMRAIAEAVGKDVEWDQSTMTANIIEKKEDIAENTLPSIVYCGFSENVYSVVFSDGFIVGAGPAKSEFNALPKYKSILLLAIVDNMDANVSISTPIIEAFIEGGSDKYYPITYNTYSKLLPEKSREGFKEMDFYEKFSLRKNGDNFDGVLYYESSSDIYNVKYDDGVHKCTLYLKNN